MTQKHSYTHRRRKLKAKISFKTLWKGQAPHVWTFYCPFCRATRKVPFRSKPGGWHYVQLGLTALVFTLLTWKWLSWKGIVSFVPFWAIFETIYRLRMRSALGCPHCGFDPYLYLNNVDKAKQEMDAHWKKKFADKGIPYPKKGIREIEEPLTGADAKS